MRDDRETLPAWVAEALRRPVAPPADAAARIMARVHAESAPARRRWDGAVRPRRGSAPASVGWSVAAAVAATVVCAAGLYAVGQLRRTAVPRHGITILADSANGARHDSVTPPLAAPVRAAADDTRAAPPSRHDSL